MHAVDSEVVEKRRGPWSDEEDIILMKHMYQYISEGYNQTDASAIIAELHLPQRTAAAVASRFSGELRFEYVRAIQIHKMLVGEPKPFLANNTSFDGLITAVQHLADEDTKLRLNHKTLQEHYDMLQEHKDNLQAEYDDLNRRYNAMKSDYDVLVRILRDGVEPKEDSDEF